jgi:hypothetical protein
VSRNADSACTFCIDVMAKRVTAFSDACRTSSGHSVIARKLVSTYMMCNIVWSINLSCHLHAGGPIFW